VVKRQSKGSCSCTCETKPIVRYTDDEKDANHSQHHNSDTVKSSDNGKAERKGHVATILRTGGLKAGAQNPIWSHSGLDKETPEVGGENLKEDLPEVGSRTFDNNEYEGGDWANYEQEKQSAEANRNSDIGWGHGSRFPWLHLPNDMCFRKQCSSNLDCCRKFNLCDRSASVCVDCWYGSTCTSEAQCCEKYPYCEMLENDVTSGEPTGRCVDAL